MSRTVKKRGALVHVQSGEQLRESLTQSEGESGEKQSKTAARADCFQNACLSFTLRAVRAYVRVWGALSRVKWLSPITAAGFVTIRKEKKTYAGGVRRAHLTPRMSFLFLCYNAR